MEASVLPQARHPSGAPYPGASPNGGPVPAIETNNVLYHPFGPDYALLVGEGTYELRDDLHLATPLPHPSEAPIVNTNPLATNVSPPTAGTRLSLVSIAPRKTSPSPRLLRPRSRSSSHLGGLRSQSLKEDARENQSSGDWEAPPRESTDSPHPTFHGTPTAMVDNGHTPAFGQSNASLTGTPPKDPLKRRKPKNNIIKSNSSFISRVVPHDTLSRRLLDRSPEGLFAFANINRAFEWLDLSSPHKAEQLTKILFTKAHPLCHDVNQLTKSTTHLDVVIGFSSADIMRYEPFSQKYARLNKNGIINAFPILDIRWIPGSENLFLAAHVDGSLVVYDREKEDATFTPEPSPETSPHTSQPASVGPTLRVLKSVNSRNQKANPVAFWKLSNQQINAFAFSPDCTHLAVVCEDGMLHVMDYLREQLLDLYCSYYGALLCVCWSPDGKYILTGGQDDLVSIWSLNERRIIARCHGHHSWVTSVAFDAWRCDERGYRFGSVGEDCRLLLWDFSETMLHRPKTASVRQRGSVASHFVAAPTGRPRAGSQHTTRFRSSSNVTSGANEGEDGIAHAAEPRARTAKLQPVLVRLLPWLTLRGSPVDGEGDKPKQVSPAPLCWLDFQEDSIIASDHDGHIRTWDRPTEPSDTSQAR
ncbi:MAG: hypothetical protein M1838_001690 [Thelocarpon superellum]|nr:MAG: hypothetical protein M1838_001690 [Thelocarpon superellum]